MGYSGTINDPMLGPAEIERIMRENKVSAKREQTTQNDNNIKNREVGYRSMDEVNGGKRGLKEKVTDVVKEGVKKKVESVVKKKILAGTPIVSAFYGAFAFFWNISTADKKKKIDFDMWDWLLIIMSNIEMIGFMLGGLAIVVIMADFVSADAGWVEATLKAAGKVVGGITKYSWDGMKALYALFHS